MFILIYLHTPFNLEPHWVGPRNRRWGRGRRGSGALIALVRSALASRPTSCDSLKTETRIITEWSGRGIRLGGWVVNGGGRRAEGISTSHPSMSGC